MQVDSRRWKRPNSVPYPSVWSRFNGLREINGAIPKFWIQDIPENQFEVILDYMVKGFLHDEPLCRYSKLTEDQLSVNEMKEMWMDILNDKLGLVCYMENPDSNGEPIIAGMNVTHLKSKFENFIEPKGVKLKNVLDTMSYASSLVNEYEMIGCDKLLGAMGLYVLPQFRGQALGLELLKAREQICRAVGIKATVTVFTATPSQKVAAKAGFKLLCECSYDDLQKIHPALTFPGIEEHTTHFKYMYIKYD